MIVHSMAGRDNHFDVRGHFGQSDPPQQYTLNQPFNPRLVQDAGFQHDTTVQSHGFTSIHATPVNPRRYSPMSQHLLNEVPTLQYPLPRAVDSFYRIGWLGDNAYSRQKPLLGFMMGRNDEKHKFLSHLVDQSIKVWLTEKGKRVSQEIIRSWARDAARRCPSFNTIVVAHGWNSLLERVLTDRSQFPTIVLSFYMSQEHSDGLTELGNSTINPSDPLGHTRLHLNGMVRQCS